MNEYKEAVGVWVHKIGNITHELEPDENDNYEFIRLKKEAQENKDPLLLQKGIEALYYSLVLKSKPEINEDEEKKKYLRRFITKNYEHITEDFMIAMGWTTVDKLKEAKKKLELETLKKQVKMLETEQE